MIRIIWIMLIVLLNVNLAQAQTIVNRVQVLPASSGNCLSGLTLSGNIAVFTTTPCSGSIATATVADILIGTNNTRFITPSALTGSGVAITLADGPVINWDMSTGYNAIVTLAGNRTVSFPTNSIIGMTYTLRVIQDSVGSRTLIWNSAFKWGALGTPILSTAPGKIDMVTLFCTVAGNSPVFLATIAKGY